MLSLNTYESWFEALSPSLVSNVYHIDIHSINVTQELKSSLQEGKLLVLFSPEIKTSGGSIDSAIDNFECLLFVLEKVNLKANNSEAERKRVRNETLAVASDIRDLMFQIAADIEIPCHFLKNINHSSVSFNKVGPVFSNMYGWALGFSISAPI